MYLAMKNLVNPSNWSDFLVLLGEIFSGVPDERVETMTKVQYLESGKLMNKDTWMDYLRFLSRLSKRSGKYHAVVLGNGLVSAKRFISMENLSWLEKELPPIAKKAKGGSGAVFTTLSIFGQYFDSKEDYKKLAGKLIGFYSLCPGTEQRTYSEIEQLTQKDFFTRFGLDVFDTFLIPVAKSQTAATFFFLAKFLPIFTDRNDTIQTEKDLDLIRHIAAKYGTRSPVILNDIIFEGVKQYIISRPISEDAEPIMLFLKETPAYIIDFYQSFKDIYSSHEGAERDEKVFAIFKEARKIKKELFEGDLSKDYNENIFFGVLYYVFSCNDMTVPKDNYIRTFKSRDDRDGDIPKSLRRSKEYGLSKGGYSLKDEHNPVNAEAWRLIIDLASDVKSAKKFDISGFGFQLLEAAALNKIKDRQEYFMRWIYQFSVNNGESLPEFEASHDVLMKYKEFVGDRVFNDLIFQILQQSINADPQHFVKYQDEIIKRKKPDYTGLARALIGPLKSKMPEDKKKEVVEKILHKNGFELQSLNPLLKLGEQKSLQPKMIKEFLDSQVSLVIEKNLTMIIFSQLFGEEYDSMQEEMVKYEFKKEVGTRSGRRYLFLLSKKKAHCCAMFNMGVCVAVDDKVWNSEDLWQIIIFDDERDAHGGMIIRTVEENNKKYLILSIQPSSSILNVVAPVQVFDALMDFAGIIAKKLKYNHILIPHDSAIHSNRGSIQSVIRKRFGKQKPLELDREYEFSYKPYNYKYKKFYMVK
ncbi:hypothetical protein ACFL0V_02675, partial [Nanoarchaeota archaeon]